MTLTIMTFCIKLNYAECRALFVVMLKVIMRNVVALKLNNIQRNDTRYNDTQHINIRM